MKCRRKTEARGQEMFIGGGQRRVGSEVVSDSVSAALSSDRRHTGLVRLCVRDLLSLQDLTALAFEMI